MISKFSVKRPYTVIVGVILVIVLGVVSFTRMTTDLLPDMNLPYALVITTDVGASPEEVEADVTAPVEASMATTSSIKNVSSVSYDNYSMVILEYEQSANMDSILIEIQQKLDQLEGSFSDSVGKPMIMQIDPDMMPVMVASADVEGMDESEVSSYVENEFSPAFESVEGVASVSATGVLEESVQVTMDQDKIDALNEKIQKKIEEQFADAQKELVSGENADPDYFGRDTGDASKDDPLNEDGIGENELLVVSFGTSFNDSRAEDIGGVEKALQAAYPDWSVRRAFTAQIIINHVQARDDEKIDNMDQALERAVDNGVKNLVVQPTHLMHGAEYDELTEAVENYKDKFESVKIAEPLLGEVGADETAINEDKAAVAEAITAEAVKTAGFDSLDAAKEEGTAFVFMGHGTSHTAKISYSQMQTQMEQLGYENVFIGTVEGEPEETSCESVIEKIKAAGYKNVVLRPLMVVAGDHANNDMAGDDDDSWKSQFEAADAFDNIETQIAGLGEIKEIQQLYVAHTKAAMDAE